MANTLNRILDKVKQLGPDYFCIHQEIPPTGAGTRRYLLGKVVKSIQNPKTDFGKQEWYGDPLPALEFEAKLDKMLR